MIGRTAVEYRGLLFQFVRRELLGRYAGTIGGPLWMVATPLVHICIYLLVFGAILKVRIPEAETGTGSFLAYFLAGLFPWMALNDSLMRSSSILLENANLITKVVFPCGLLPASAAAAAFLLNLTGLLLFMGYLALSTGPDPLWALLPLEFAGLFAFALGLSALLSALTVFLRDIREFLGTLLMVWFYATPIIYPPSMVPESLRFLLALNPMHHHLLVVRALLFGRTPPLLSVWLSASASLISLTFGVWAFRRLKPSFGDVL